MCGGRHRDGAWNGDAWTTDVARACRCLQLCRCCYHPFQHDRLRDDGAEVDVGRDDGHVCCAPAAPPSPLTRSARH